MRPGTVSLGRMRRALNHPLAWVVIGYLAWRRLWAFGEVTSLDLDVYIRGAHDLSSGLSPYRDVEGLPYTYPPFSALLFMPLTWLPTQVAHLVFLVVSAVSYLVLVAVFGRRLHWTPIEIAWVAVLALRLEPVVRTFHLGQVNFLLAAAVAIDLFVVPARFRGMLIGLAAGVKLTPAVFGAAFLLQRDWGSALRSVGTGVVTVIIGLAVLPGESWRYWTQLLRDPRRIGHLDYPDNQSLVGVAARAFGQDQLPGTVMLPLQLTGLALGCGAAWWCVRRARAAGRRPDLVAVALCLAVASLLASPVSWSHHWIWAVPGIMWLLHRRWWLAALAWIAVLYAANWLLPELRPGPVFDDPWWASTLPLLAVVTVLAGCWPGARGSLGRDRDVVDSAARQVP